MTFKYLQNEEGKGDSVGVNLICVSKCEYRGVQRPVHPLLRIGALASGGLGKGSCIM